MVSYECHLREVASTYTLWHFPFCSHTDLLSCISFCTDRCALNQETASQWMFSACLIQVLGFIPFYEPICYFSNLQRWAEDTLRTQVSPSVIFFFHNISALPAPVSSGTRPAWRCPPVWSLSSAETPGGSYGHTVSSGDGSSLQEEKGERGVGTRDQITTPTHSCQLMPAWYQSFQQRTTQRK